MHSMTTVSKRLPRTPKPPGPAAKSPVKFELDDDHYEVVVGSIIFQQLAGSAAQAILNRFKQLYGGRLPSPREYLSTDVEKLRGSGLSPQKISYIKDLAERLENGTLD